jgi:hypothetical protein
MAFSGSGIYELNIKEEDIMSNFSSYTADLVVRFGMDTTTRLSFRKGDFLLHIRYNNMYSDSLSIIDVWELNDRQFATVTNRYEDLPEWFQLHPTEVCGILVDLLLDKFNRGDYPAKPIDGPNVWRIKSGDYLIWLGASRSDMSSNEGILKIYSFSQNALLVGEPVPSKIEQLLQFGALTNEYDDEKVNQSRNAINIVKQLGKPRRVNIDWQLE